MLTRPAPPAIDTVFRAFSDRTRLRIMNLLQGEKELCVCDLVRVLDMPQAKVSRHLAYLRRAGLVAARRDGQWMHYRLLGPTGTFHKKLLECLRCCFNEVPELQADRKRLHGGEPCGPDDTRGCC